MTDATHHGVAGTPGEGAYLLLWLVVADGTLLRASYETFGCPAAIACGSLLCELLVGRTASQALLITERDLVLLLGGLPPGREHCPKLALVALRNALAGEK
jgi:NifU-like protein involved in Fe-S cluster formation